MVILTPDLRLSATGLSALNPADWREEEERDRQRQTDSDRQTETDRQRQTDRGAQRERGHETSLSKAAKGFKARSSVVTLCEPGLA